MLKKMILISQAYVIRKAEALGYNLSDTFDNTNIFLVLDPNTKKIESTSSRKAWASDEYRPMLDEEFMKTPIPAEVGDYCIEFTMGNDIGGIFQVNKVLDTEYESVDGITYPKDKSSKLTATAYKDILDIIRSNS